MCAPRAEAVSIPGAVDAGAGAVGRWRTRAAGARQRCGRAAGGAVLAWTLEATGVAVDTAVVYQQLAPRVDDAARALVAASTVDERHVWLFSSSEAIALMAAMPGTDWRGARWAHPRIADAARTEAGFGSVCMPATSTHWSRR